MTARCGITSDASFATLFSASIQAYHPADVAPPIDSVRVRGQSNNRSQDLINRD
jgi:hypothetical protein